MLIANLHYLIEDLKFSDNLSKQLFFEIFITLVKKIIIFETEKGNIIIRMILLSTIDLNHLLSIL